MHYLLFYEVGDDYVAKRAQFRDAHLKKAWEASDCGELVLGGALANPVDGAVLLFKGDSPEVAAQFARSDPYVTGGAVKRWHVREWTTVVGKEAANPVRPQAVDVSEKPPGLGRTSNARQDLAEPKSVILRMWKGHATAEKAPEYVRHAATRVFALRSIEGFRDGYLLRRVIDDAIEFTVLTLWRSMDAVRRFAGNEPQKAVIDPEAREVLSGFDESVSHFEIVDVEGGTSASRDTGVSG